MSPLEAGSGGRVRALGPAGIRADASVPFAGLAPGFTAGLVQINARLPDDCPTGQVPLTVTIDGIESQPAIFMYHFRIAMKPIVFCVLGLLLAGLSYGQDDAKFTITAVQTPSKQSVIKDVERDFFSPLSQELWDTLPKMLEVTFKFAPHRGNTDRLGDTFLLKVPDMGVLVAGKHYPAHCCKEFLRISTEVSL